MPIASWRLQTVAAGALGLMPGLDRWLAALTSGLAADGALFGA